MASETKIKLTIIPPTTSSVAVISLPLAGSGELAWLFFAKSFSLGCSVGFALVGKVLLLGLLSFGETGLGLAGEVSD